MAESIQKELDEYRASEEEVKRLKNVMVGFKVYILVSCEENGIIMCITVVVQFLFWFKNV